MTNFLGNSVGVGAGFLTLTLITAASAETFTSNEISFRDITASIEIVTTTGDEIDIVIDQGNNYTQVKLEEKDGVVYVTGERWVDDNERNCCDNRITRTFDARADRKMSTGDPLDTDFFDKYPTIKVAMPFEGDVEFIDARMTLKMDRLAGKLSLDACYVYGETSDVDEAVIGVIHGSRLVIGNVASGLEIDVSGDADVMTGDAAIVDVDIAGPGDVILGDIDGMLDVSIAGSGLVRSTYVDGPVTARIAGSGALAVKDGAADKLKATIDGSGAVYFNGEATQPVLRLYGSSEVRMRSVKGRITHHGSGDVYVGDNVFYEND